MDDPERVDSKKTVRLEYQIYRRLPRSWCRSDPGGGWIGLVTLGPILEDFDHSNCWYAECYYSRTVEETPDILRLRRPDIPIIPPRKRFRNPLIVAMELQEELVRDDLTRKQLAERHGISSDRVTQWLCLLKLPDHEKARILALGDNWERQVVTERELCSRRKGRRPI